MGCSLLSSGINIFRKLFAFNLYQTKDSHPPNDVATFVISQVFETITEENFVNFY